jgi:hypothetical protein
MYNIKLDTVGVKYKGKGESVEEALAMIDLTWNQIKGKGLVTVNVGKNSLEHLFTTIQLRRMFGNKFNRILWGKRLQMLFDDKYKK